MKTLREAGELKDKKVLLRVDFDVPVSDKGHIEESFRIKRQKETLAYLVDHGAKVIMVSHISDQSINQSFAALMPQLHMLLGHEAGFIKTIEDITAYLANYPGAGLLENIRKFPGEMENDRGLALSLSKGFDLYVNNDFAVCHRDHASVSVVTKLLPSYAGFVIEEETSNLKGVIDAPGEGKLLIIGGAKASTKIPVIDNFIAHTEKILIGGVIANDILKKKGVDVGASVVDENLDELFVELDTNDLHLVIPVDFVRADNKILDIGPKTSEEFAHYIASAKLIIWNGPMGLFENPAFAHGTKAVAEAMVSSKARKIIGGGDTITAVDGLGLLGKFDFVSTGGGAMLAFLAGEKLPGLDVLGYYN